MKSVKPIKRNPVLTEFSRDHHFGLLLVWKIRQGLKNEVEPERIINYILFYFNKDLQTHFAEEERLLFDKLSEQSELKRKAVSDHAEIYKLIEDFRLNKTGNTLIKQFADKLEEHIRFEERELFNYIQTCLSEKDLTEIASQFSRSGHEVEKTWPDEFWAHKY